MGRLRNGPGSAIRFPMLAKQVIRAASGWLELGMPDDALGELASLSVDERGENRVRQLKLAAEMAKEDWESASATALGLCEQAVDEPEHFLSAAYCLHETGKTAKAKECLLGGPAVLREMPVFHYNMACYLWILGERKTAKDHLDKAVEMDGSFLDSARADKDLAGMEI